MYYGETYVRDKAGEDYEAEKLHEAHDPFQNSASEKEKVDAIIRKWEEKKLYNKEDGFESALNQYVKEDGFESALNVEQLIASLHSTASHFFMFTTRVLMLFLCYIYLMLCP